MFNMTLSALYDLSGGPLLWLAAAAFVLGSAWRIGELFLLTKKTGRTAWPSRGLRTDSPGEKRFAPVLWFRRSLAGKHPVMALVSFLFHACLFIAPLFALGHALLFRQSWGIRLFTVPELAFDILTACALMGALFMLMRRLLMPAVRVLSGMADFVFLALVIGPFLTGFMAYHHWLDYRTVITLHMLTGEALLVAIPFTKPVHMIFSVFVRALVKSEHFAGRVERVWIP